MIVCEQIRKVQDGYIVVARFPYGNYDDKGEVICKDVNEVVQLLLWCAGETAPQK